MNITCDKWYENGKITSINSYDIFYNRAGKGEVLLCIHGFPSSSWDFEAVWPELTSRFDVIAHDLIGLGKSAKPDMPISVALQADIIEELLLNLGVNEAHILAHDLGDTVAQELLARQFDNTSKVNWKTCVLMNGGIFPETHKPLFTQLLLLSSLGPIVVKFMSEKTLKKSFTKIFSKANPPSDQFINDTWNLIIDNNGRKMIPKLLRYMFERKVNRARWVTPIEKGVVPIRLINGIEDPISGKHMAEHFEKLIPNADVVYLENAGHYPHVERPKEVLKSFFEFHEKLTYSE